MESNANPPEAPGQTATDEVPNRGEPFKFKWQDALDVIGILLAVGGMSDMPIGFRVACFVACAICMCFSFVRHTEWPKSLRISSGFGVCVFMGILIGFALKKHSEKSPESVQIVQLKASIDSQDEQRRFLALYPLGYTIFDVNYVTGAVTPFQVRQGMEPFEFDFRSAGIRENTPAQISVQLPDIFKDGKAVLPHMVVGWDRGASQVHPLGFTFGDPPNRFVATAQILQDRGDRVIWILGIRRIYVTDTKPSNE